MKTLTESESERHRKLSESGEIPKSVIYGIRIPEVKEGILKIKYDGRMSLKFKLVNLDPEFNYMIFIHINELEEPNKEVFKHLLKPFDCTIMRKEGDDYGAEGSVKIPCNSLHAGEFYLTLTLTKILMADEENNTFKGLIQDSRQLTFKVEEM